MGLDGRPIEYTGGRTADSIVTWVLKKVGPPAILLEDAAAAERFEAENKLAVIGLFQGGQSREAFETAARQMEDVMFAYSTSPEVFARYGISASSAVRMFYPHDDKAAEYLGDLASVTGIESFVKAHRMPFVSIFDADIAADL